MPNPTHTLEVALPGAVEDRSYPILIGRGLLADCPGLATLLDDAPVVLVTNETVAPLYLRRVRDALGRNRQVTEVILPDGEDQKQLANANRIWQCALEDRHERRSIFIALGGGVIGDLTGFAAACFCVALASSSCPQHCWPRSIPLWGVKPVSIMLWVRI